MEVLSTVGSAGVLAGPNINQINEFVASFMEERTATNSVIWDLVHGVNVTVNEVLRGVSQRVYIESMRDDFEGFSPLHLLAIQGKIKILTEVLRVRAKVKSCFRLYKKDNDLLRYRDSQDPLSFFVGNRSVSHLLALGGHINHVGSRKDEYEGTPKDIAKIVGEKRGEKLAGKWKISSEHIDALDLLKIWIGCKPTELFREQVEGCRKRFEGFKIIEEDVIEVVNVGGALGFSACVTKDIPAFCIIGTYLGVYDSTSFSNILEEFPDWIDKNPAFFPKRAVVGEYFSGMVDAETYCSKEAFINDQVPPSIFFLSELARDGLLAKTRCLTLRNIKRGEFLGTSYANHPMRIRPDYFEDREAIGYRNEMILNLQRKLSSLTLYDQFGLNSIIKTPQLIFRWLKSGELNLQQLESILGHYLGLGVPDETIGCAQAFLKALPKLKNPDVFSLFLRQWIDPILNSKDLLGCCSQNLMYEALKYAFNILDKKNFLYMRQHQIFLEVKWLDEIRFEAKIKEVLLKESF